MNIADLRDWVHEKFTFQVKNNPTNEPEEEPEEKPDVYRSITRDGCPTAPFLEKKRLKGRDVSILRQLTDA
jgi:hypothetical protein